MSIVEKIKYNTADNIKQAFEKIKTNQYESPYWLINGVWHFRIGGTNTIGISKVVDKKKLSELNDLLHC